MHPPTAARSHPPTSAPAPGPAPDTRATVSHLFSTPVARATCPFAAEINPALAARTLERADERAKEFGYKRETTGEFTAWGGPDAIRLSRWVCAVSRRFAEALTGTDLAEAHARSAAREADPDTTPYADPRTDPNAGPGPGRGPLPAVSVGVTRSWASLYRSGDRHEDHMHPNTALSAVYYVAAPDRCDLELLDPRPAVDYYDPGITLAGESSRVRLSCVPGELLVFPGWLRHRVPEFHGPDTRVSVAWNLNYTLGG
ncbi:TIGR02466 family protein (plasmid) [Streptomyces sp. BI20]|uniref:TIGR02466 family protein n=1 Tax=Streptomyces sp. BI20 TaxID=3403460 RepID=UPI003C739A80